ncbi:MAG TPA: YeeE/YedE thiosulfate transporter family protein [Ohtaekwangia sp.]|nr:YeeE/YedE thiosulfate transporter family protein [Ohtaekwangia sp.]
METLIDFISQPWPWYVAGPLIGAMVPLLLIVGNKAFGISSSLRHICAACIPAKIPFFHYDWKKEAWNLFFVTGIFFGAMIAAELLSSPVPAAISGNLKSDLAQYGINDYRSMVPPEIFNFQNLATLQGFLMMIGGGFLVGFGTRYAGGCTSGHSIMGISALQVPSMIATACFMIGGVLMANVFLPYILALS